MKQLELLYSRMILELEGEQYHNELVHSQREIDNTKSIVQVRE